MSDKTLNTMFYMAEDYDRLIEAAEKLCKCKTASDVARFLGILENGDQILQNWKNRGIPRTRINEISRKIGCNPFWLEDGEGIMEFVYAKTQAQARVLTAMQTMKHQEDENTVVKISDSLAQRKNEGTNGKQ